MNCSHSLIDERNFFLWLWSESYDKNFSRNAGNVFTLVILRRFESLESRSEMDNYIFYHEYSFDDFHSLTPLNWPPLPTANELEPFSFLKHNNEDKFRVCCGQFWSFISFSVPNNNFFPSPTKKKHQNRKKINPNDCAQQIDWNSATFGTYKREKSVWHWWNQSIAFGRKARDGAQT